MPTGYTAGLKINTPFKEFALQCARGMGALITMRDDPHDARIPDEFKPSMFYKEHLEKSEAELARLKGLTEEGWHAEYEKYSKTTVTDRTRTREKDKDQAAIYKRMITLAEAWVPPTPDHDGMKKFMLEQLRSSLDHDVFGEEYMDKWRKVKTYADWKVERLSGAARSVALDAQHWEKEQERTRERNEWVRALRESLEITTREE